MESCSGRMVASAPFVDISSWRGVFRVDNVGGSRLEAHWMEGRSPRTLRRTEIGFDTTDHVLDAVINPDLSSWEWKDEGEFAEAMDLDLFGENMGEQIRRETSRVASEALITRREQLKQWATWRPPVGWRIPNLVPSWEVV